MPLFEYLHHAFALNAKEYYLSNVQGKFSGYIEAKKEIEDRCSTTEQELLGFHVSQTTDSEFCTPIEALEHMQNKIATYRSEGPKT